MTKHNPDIPNIPMSIIRYLDKNINSNNIKDLNTLEDLRYLQGQLAVVDLLRSIAEQQARNGNILNV